MSNTNQYFFSLEKLKAILGDFSKPPYSGYELKGFVFTPGLEEEKSGKYKDCVYPFPVYSKNPKAGSDGDILLQNTNAKYIGCPYPPPCDSKHLREDCYGNEKK